MQAQRFQRVKEIFAAVFESGAEDRCALLNSLCENEDDIRSEVESLLEHAECPALDIEVAASHLGGLIAAAANNGTHRIAMPEHIGSYRILQLIGEGGMGVVYLAQQDRPRRTVALKVIRPGFATPSLVRRFEHEAHVLGRLQHPGIAQIYDAGLAPTDGGVQPFLVMEYFEGVGLLDYAKQRDISEARRVQLMIDVCNAVQHAHVRGVIHRDLKPANILVNDAGQSKVLDFGVARVTDSDTPANAAPTVQGQIVGTLAYMSPEQLAGDQNAIDTRSDVYALGVICFELFTGVLPYETKGRSLAELMSALQGGALAPPSPLLRGDLHTITLKAMNPARERRYQSAFELADDLRRYLAGEPINARRDSVAYLVRKQLRRYRNLLLFVMLALCGTILFALHALNQAEQFASLAERERESRQAAEAAEQQAVVSEQQASRRRDESQAVTGFLMAMLKMADPDVSEDYDASVRTLLAEASKQVAGSFEQFPEAESEIRGALGRIFATLGEFDEAEAHLRRAITLNDANPNVSSETMYALLWPFLHLELDLNDPMASARLRAERLGRSMIEERDSDLAERFRHLRHQARREVSDAHIQGLVHEVSNVVQTRYSANDRIWLLVADQFHLLGLSHRLSGHPAHAAVYFAGALAMYRAALNETSPRIARTLGDYTDALLGSQRFQDAMAVAQHSLDVLQSKLPPGHWYGRVYEARVAQAMLQTGRADEAIPILLECHRSIATARGHSSPMATNLMAHLIRHYDSINQEARARELRHQYAAGLSQAISHVTLDHACLALRGDFPEVADALRHLAGSFTAPDGKRAAELTEQAIRLSRERVDPGSVYAGLLADLFTAWGGPQASTAIDVDTRFALLDESRRITELCPHRHGRKAGGTLWWLANHYAQSGDAESAVALARSAVETLQSSLPAHDTFIQVAQSLLAGALTQQGRYEESFPLAVSSYSRVVEAMGIADPNSLIAMGRVLRVAALTNQVHNVAPLVMNHLQHLLANPPNEERCVTAVWMVVMHSSLSSELYDDALELILQTGSAEPRGRWGQTVLGAAFFRVGRNDDALRVFNQLDAGENASAIVLTFLTLSYANANREAEAAATFARLAQKRQSDHQGWSPMDEMLFREAEHACLTE